MLDRSGAAVRRWTTCSRLRASLSLSLILLSMHLYCRYKYLFSLDRNLYFGCTYCRIIPDGYIRRASLFFTHHAVCSDCQVTLGLDRA
jgi:hypothetical protein